MFVLLSGAPQCPKPPDPVRQPTTRRRRVTSRIARREYTGRSAVLPAGEDGSTDRAASPASWGPTEDGLARALLAWYGRDLRYCPQTGRWLRWSAYRWVWDEADLHWQWVLQLGRPLP